MLVDALPYIDHGYSEPGVREAALALVDEEMRRYRPTKNYLQHLPAVDTSRLLTPLISAEFQRLSVRQPMDVLSMRRYELPTPPSAKLTDISAWNECVDNSWAQLQQQNTRLDNLQLLMEFGSEAWREHNKLTSAALADWQKRLAHVKHQVQQVNWTRKQAQLAAGDQLQQLEASWVQLVGKNYDIEQACARLEAQVWKLRGELEEAKKQ